MNTAGWSKAVGLGLVGLVLTMVLGRIAWLVQERQERQQAAQQEVAESTASSQLLRGPYLERLCTEEWTVTETTVDDRGQRESRRREARQARLRSTPAALQINGDLKPQQLERGLFKVSTYQAQLQLNARWDTLQEVQLSSAKPEAEVRCDAIRLVMEVSDARGLRSVALQLNEQALTTRPGTPSGGNGLHALLDAALPVDKPLQLKAQMELLGTEALNLLPAAAQVQASLRSSWPHPSFQGRFLPNERSVSPDGFTATWRVTELASGAAAALRANKEATDQFGVALIDPINPYSLSDRAIKYGFLFIALTLAAVMLAELLGHQRVHPVQYGFVGLAMALFFLLLLALSEHLAFGPSYALAAAAATGLLAHYARGLFGNWRSGLGFGAGVGSLYGALYVVLNLEKASLLLGALMLFVLLAAAMRATRDVDWYGLTQR
jgi:inner membrane protein